MSRSLLVTNRAWKLKDIGIEGAVYYVFWFLLRRLFRRQQRQIRASASVSIFFGGSEVAEVLLLYGCRFVLPGEPDPWHVGHGGSRDGDASPGAANGGGAKPAGEIQALEDVVEDEVLGQELQEIHVFRRLMGFTTNITFSIYKKNKTNYERQSYLRVNICLSQYLY